MRRLKGGGWPYSQPPNVQFEINWDSQQADGLVLWMPWGGGTPGARLHVDKVSGQIFTEGSTPTWVFDADQGWSLLFDNATNERLDHTGAIIPEAPLTMMCRFNSDDVANLQTGISISDNGNNFFAVQLEGNRGVKTISGIAKSVAAGFQLARSTAAYSANTWHHATFVVASPTSRTIILDAGGVGTNNTNVVPLDLNLTQIGIHKTGQAMSGLLTDIRLYNVTKTLEDVKQVCNEDTRWELWKSRIRRWIGWAPTAAAPQTIELDALTLAGNTPSLTQVSGAVSVPLDALSLTSSAENLTLTTTVTIPLDALTLTGSTPDLTQASGAVSVECDALTLTGSAGTLTVVPGATSVALDALTLSGSATTLTIATGAVSIACDALSLVSSAETLTVTTGITIALDALTLTGSVPTLTVGTGAISVAVDALTLASSAESLTQSSGAVSIAADALSLVSSTPSLTQVSGAVSVACDALSLASSAETLTVTAGIIVGLDALTLVGSAENLTQVPGVVTIAVDALSLTSTAESLTWTGIVTLGMDALTLTGVSRSLTVVPGAASVVLDTLTLTGTVPSLTVTTAGILKVDASLSIVVVTVAQLDYAIVTSAASVIHTRD